MYRRAGNWKADTRAWTEDGDNINETFASRNIAEDLLTYNILFRRVSYEHGTEER